MLDGTMAGGEAGAGRRKKEAEGPKTDASGASKEAPKGSLRARRSQEAQGKRKGAQDAPAEEKPPKSLAVRIAGPAALVFVLIFAGFLGFYDGGPDSERPGGPSTPQVDEWKIEASLPDGSTQVLCDTDTEECSLEQLWPAAAAGWECTFSARVWLATDSNPVFLRGVRMDALNVTTMGGDPEYSDTQEDNATGDDAGNDTTQPTATNFTIDYQELDRSQEVGLWLRPVAKRVDLETQVPCDTMTVSLRMELSGKGFFGGAWSADPSATQLIHKDVSGIAGLEDFESKRGRR